MSGSTAWKIFGFLVPAVAIFLGLAQTVLWPSGWLRNALSGHVEGSGPKTYVLSDDPVVVLVKDFIRSEAASHLIALAYVRPTARLYDTAFGHRDGAVC